MANNRELLEMAAKAAGYEYWTTDDHDRLLVLGADKLRRPWNPLTDDGDALRLKVKLGIVIDRSEVKPACWAYYDFRDAWYEAMVDHGDDAYAATRLAITMVAAEIGKGMR